MTSSIKLASLVVATFTAVAAGCSSSSLNSTGTGGSPGTGGEPATGGSIGTGGSPGTGGCPGAVQSAAKLGLLTTLRVPPEHRAVATACTPSTRSPAIPDAGLLSCTTDADCAVDGAANFFNTCLHGQCSFDQCLTDADCGATEVCVCASDYYGGNAQYHANVCVPSNCRVDSDCGSGGYCSPSRGTCGSYQGFYCHTAGDSCVDPATDCAGCGSANACVYGPSGFVCGSTVCAG